MTTKPVFEIRPLHSLGPVRLGSSRADARHALSRLGFALENARGKSDFFCNASIQVSCDDAGKVHFVGITGTDQFEAQFKGQDVFSLAAPELFSLVAASDESGAHEYDPHEYCFPNQVVTVWDADAQYDRHGAAARPVWGQVGVGSPAYGATFAAILNGD